ncbi:MAG TPA: adenine deaminase [Ktedonobacterales bacterium]|nr:adenine deaminase [Ktedonobacterales bacterium]
MSANNSQGPGEPIGAPGWTLEERRALIQVARGKQPADLVLRDGQVVNVFSNEIHPADVAIYHGRIAGIGPRGAYGGVTEVSLGGHYLTPGLIEAHTHIESTLLTPGEFARALAPHGTTTCISDPHEIANVAGVPGINWMLAAAQGVPLRLLFTLPSCVPASQFESSGATILPADLLPLARHPRIASVGEVMNYPAVLAGDAVMLGMIALGQPGHAAPRGLPVDGHAPGLKGLDLCAYVAAGAQSDHESFEPQEALEKLRLGMWLWVREGSMRNLAALLPVILAHLPERAGFVADDLTCGDLQREGDLDHILRLAVAGGLDPIQAIKMTSLHPAQYFGFGDRGAIAPGYLADLLVVPDLRAFRPRQVYVGGDLVAENGRALFVPPPPPSGWASTVERTVHVTGFDVSRLRLPGHSGSARVIGMIPDQIVTEVLMIEVEAVDGQIVASPEHDLLKVAVVERYGRGRIGVGLLHGLGLRVGAIASSVAHDAHNIVVAGTNDADMALAVREIEHMAGGLVLTRDGAVVARLALPLGGLVSPAPATEVTAALDRLQSAAEGMGVRLARPFIFLSFLALSVVPKLKITDFGVLDVGAWEIVPVQS